MTLSRDAAPTALAPVVDALAERLDRLPPQLAAQRAFGSTYLRTTVAVGQRLGTGFFEDDAWLERWDIAFADLYLTAIDQELARSAAPGAGSDPALPSRPWRLAFGADPGLHPLLHVLLGINAHVNYDLPQSLLAVIDDEEFADPAVLARRGRDHERIDLVLAARVAAEDQALGSEGRRVRDRLLTPVNRLSSRRFLRESRRCVWHNTLALQAARRHGPEAYAVRLGELEVLSAAKINDLLRPGQVLLRLAVAGFGVMLPPAG